MASSRSSGIGRGSIIRWPRRATSRADTICEPSRHVRWRRDRRQPREPLVTRRRRLPRVKEREPGGRASGRGQASCGANRKRVAAIRLSLESDRAHRLSELFSGSGPSRLGGLHDIESAQHTAISRLAHRAHGGAPQCESLPSLPTYAQAGRKGDRPKSKAHRPPSEWSAIGANQPILESCRSGQIARRLEVGVALQGRPPA